MSSTQPDTESFVSPGMPPLGETQRTTSFFEFWPTWLMYLPVVIQWLLLSIYYRSLTLPLIANPKLPLSGMVGIPKSDLLSQAGDLCNQAILPWFVHTKSSPDPQHDCRVIEEKMEADNFTFPVVCKPDIGCRGSGVKLIHNQQQLQECVASYPIGASIMLQQLADYEPEAGIFFVKAPEDERGQIISLALKYTPYVVGNGKDTLDQLITHDERANLLQHLYKERHSSHLNDIIPEGTPYRLVFSASHCRGAIFKNAAEHITPELTSALNTLLADLPEFYYGRLDIKFSNMDDLRHGKHLQIIEINTASSESLHIWDSDATFTEAIFSLLFQYKTLFKLGEQNRRRGFKTPSLLSLLKHWKKERDLTQHHPTTD